MKIFSNLPRKIFIHVIVTVVSSQNIQHSILVLAQEYLTP